MKSKLTQSTVLAALIAGIVLVGRARSQTFTDANWMALGSGMNSNVFALALSGSNLYAAGWFNTAGGSPANYVAKWNGSSWSALGSSLNSAVYALAVLGDELYAGRDDTVAKWNGSSWSGLGAGLSGSGSEGAVDAMAASGSNVYVGGPFTTAGGGLANHVAKWDGSSWSALGSGMGGVPFPTVLALAVSDSGELYAGGAFTTAGGSPANKIAKWDGNSWTNLGSGMNDTVVALAVSGGNLYAGGLFTTAGGSPANYVAKWDGSSWSALSSGLSGSAYALAASGNNLYVGGSWTTAGGKPAAYIARAYLLPLPTLSTLRSGANVTLSWPISFGGFVLQQNRNVANPNGWSNSVFPFSTNGAIKSATVPLTTNQFFRLSGS